MSGELIERRELHKLPSPESQSANRLCGGQTTSLLCLFVVLGSGGNVFPWTHPLIIASAVSFAVLCAVFVKVESKAIKPILPLSVFGFPTRNLILTGFLFSMINYTV